MEKSKKVMLLSIIIVMGFTFGVIYHYILADYLHMQSPYNSFLYPPDMALCDIFAITPRITDFNPFKSVTLWIVYFPLTYIIMMPFAFIKNKILAYALYSLGFVLYFSIMNAKKFSCPDLSKLQNFQNAFIITACSYPFLYIMDKGNFDMFLFVLFGFLAYAFSSKKYKTSAVLLAIMNAIKPFTILFLLLFLKEKRYKEFFLNILLTCILVFGGFFAFKGDFFDQIVNLIKSVGLFKFVYALPPVLKIGFCSSIFMPLKAILVYFTDSQAVTVLFVKIYDYFCYLATAITAIFIWREKTFWKQLTLLINNFILLPYITYDYKLIFLFIPIWFWVNEKRKSKFDYAYLILFAIVLIPKSIVISTLTHSGTLEWITVSAIINPIALTLLSLLIITEQYIPSAITEQTKED
jgi:hypothetical protein